ncbi:sortase [Arthrobacter sp. JZ12]|uniref:class F sortase n=1 Tax=Arthrobacter sp. JZ12 TaxID=2654190 RepID=UPI002B46A7C8|nr:class F sortase [Arthrobacter sp. JZ12]WRH24185.1 sortase [Arthrobacter sp. JZ12]
MTSSTFDRRRGFYASAAVAVLLLTGCGGGGQSAENAAALPTAAQVQTSSPEPAPSETPSVTTEVMAASEPISVHIPSTGTESELLSLGLRENGTLEVPPDGPGAPASWFNGSPTPGELGPAVLLGHVNATDGGPGVFADLRALGPGDLIEVARADGTTAVFVFDRGEQYSKDAFPTEKVYGNTEESELRLITCDGYDPATGNFDDNYVVYAKLVS